MGNTSSHKRMLDQSRCMCCAPALFCPPHSTRPHRHYCYGYYYYSSHYRMLLLFLLLSLTATSPPITACCYYSSYYHLLPLLLLLPLTAIIPPTTVAAATATATPDTAAPLLGRICTSYAVRPLGYHCHIPIGGITDFHSKSLV